MMHREITRQRKGMEVWESLGKSPPSYPVFVSFFTDQFYLREAYELARSLQAFNLDYRIEQVPDLASWGRNTNHKPDFLITQHRRFSERSLCWLDADARVRSMPTLFDGVNQRGPIAYHTDRRRPKPCSGTVFLKNDDKRYWILDAWRLQCVKDPQATDQVCMGRAVEMLGIIHDELPEEYCWIYDISAQLSVPNPGIWFPVIEHMQASRWVEKEIR
jgi:hypothetical protein